MAILYSMFCLGVFSTLTQIMFVREMLVAFLGNELSIGAVFGGWLIGISAGAFSGRLILRRFSLPSEAGTLPDNRKPRTAHAPLYRLLTTILLMSSVLLPAQMYALRSVRTLFNVPMGEYAPLAVIAAGALLIFLPSSWCIGAFFPCACHALSLTSETRNWSPARNVGIIYTLESLGSMAGGMVLTFVLLRFLTSTGIILLASCMPLAAAAFIIRQRSARLSLTSVVIALLIVALCPGCSDTIDHWAAQVRWRSFGVLPKGNSGQAVRLVASSDSVYQNLAIIESSGQYALYANGQVMFVFPDPMSYELQVRFIMAQKPSARRILVIGGNPVGELPELLKFPVERVVYVELDPRMGEMVHCSMKEQYEAVFADSRVQYVPEDPPRFARQCREQFDVILIDAPQPNTAASNRYYTLDFLRNIRRILASDGFMYTRVQSSEELQKEAAELGASVYRTLKQVFPVVLVTWGACNQFFAGGPASDITFDRQTLYLRSKNDGIPATYFQPEYFLTADEISPEKTDFVRQRFESACSTLNTSLRPITYFYNIVLWSRVSGSRVEAFLKSAQRLRLADVLRGVLVLALGCLAAGLAIRNKSASLPRLGRWWRRLMIAALLAVTGFSAMALEILLAFIFQSLYGYVYTRIGLIVAVFMLGLVIGAPSGRLMAAGTIRRTWLCMTGLEILLIIFPLALPLLMMVATKSAVSDAAWWVEGAIYMAVALVAWAVGAQFPIGNRLFCDVGGPVGTAAAVTDAADHFGAAAGSFVAGAILMPVLGIGISCVVLALLKGLSLCFLLSSALVAMAVVSAPTTTDKAAC